MKSVVKKWGNSAAIRIPVALLQATSLKLDDTVDVREEGGRIVIEPEAETTYDLQELVGKITSKNRHEPVDSSDPVGNEVW